VVCRGFVKTLLPFKVATLVKTVVDAFISPVVDIVMRESLLTGAAGGREYEKLDVPLKSNVA